MSGLTIYGTTTSPYVRRARVVAHELGVEVDLINTFDPEGQKAMRAVNPIWKVPTGVVGGLSLLDSQTICEYLLHNHGPGPLEPLLVDNLHEHNVLSVIDGVLDSLINVFYLTKDGVSAEKSSYAAKQQERAASGMAWLEGLVTGPWLSQVQQLGLPEIAMVTTLDWMRFRNTYDVSQHSNLQGLAEHWGARESFRATYPAAS